MCLLLAGRMKAMAIRGQNWAAGLSARRAGIGRLPKNESMAPTESQMIPTNRILIRTDTEPCQSNLFTEARLPS